MKARLLQLVSAGLPVGGFSYSRGLESAITLGWIDDAPSGRAWVSGLLAHQASRVDAPLVARLWDAWSMESGAEVERWTRLADALRETDELQRESRTMGRALARLVGDLGLAPVSRTRVAGEAYVSAFALAAVALDIERRDAVHGYLWAWLEASVIAAVKLVPIGQTEGQRWLLALGGELDALVDQALALGDDEIGAIVPGLAIASSLHETQHTRLYRS